MTDHTTRAPLSRKSLLVLVVVAALFVWANSAERSPGVGQFERGMPLTCCLRSHATTQRVDPATRQPTGELSVSPEGMEYILVTRLLIDVAVALSASVLLALASERFVFRRLRRGPHPKAMEEPK